MTTFNFNKFLSKIAKKGDAESTEAKLREDSGCCNDSPDTLTEKQIDKDRKENKETTTEEKLEKVRTGSSDSLVEGLLNSSKSKLHQHRNEDTSAGDMCKIEEQRIKNKNRQETEKQETSSETGKKNRLLDYISKDDGLKLASWGWEFGKISKVVPKGSVEAFCYCKDCGTAYDVKPSMTSGGQMCEKCGGINISEIEGAKGGVSGDSDTSISPIQLNTSKPMPKLQSSQKKVVTAGSSWDFNDDLEPVDLEPGYESEARKIMDSDEVDILPEEDDSSISGKALKELRNPAFDSNNDGAENADFSEDEDEEEEAPNFEEETVGISTATGTKLLTIQVTCFNTEAYEDDLGTIDDDGKKRFMTDVLAHLVTVHPEMRENISSNMLNTSKIQDGKVSYQLPV